MTKQVFRKQSISNQYEHKYNNFPLIIIQEHIFSMNFSKNFQVSEIYLNKKATLKKIKKNNINEDKNNIKKNETDFFFKLCTTENIIQINQQLKSKVK